MKNTNEIKKAWNTFKKEIAKEITTLELNGCCYMTAKQIENGTATITVGNDWEYDGEIAYLRRRIEDYSTWDGENEERGQRLVQEAMEKIETFEAKKAAYGTKENEARCKVEQITNSTAFKKLVKAIEIQDTAIELNRYSSGLNIYQLRISY